MDAMRSNFYSILSRQWAAGAVKSVGPKTVTSSQISSGLKNKVRSDNKLKTANFPARILLLDSKILSTVHLTSTYHPQEIEGKFTVTPGVLTTIFYGCKD